MGSENRRRVVVVQNRILHYRIPIYELMSKSHDVTIVHSGSRVEGDFGFQQVVLDTTPIGPFLIQRSLFHSIRRLAPDGVIFMMDIRWLASLYAIWRLSPKIQVSWWGMDRGASDLATQVKLLIARLSRKSVFYNDEIRDYFVARGLDPSKTLVANNTVAIDNRKPCFDFPEKDALLFVGSMDSRKQNQRLLRIFSSIRSKLPADLKLVLVGDGTEFELLQKLAEKIGGTDGVVFHGRLESGDALIPLYERSLLSVSLGQAGLSVLQSLGMGVPFITLENAISGGEKHNIVDGYNGFFCRDNDEEIAELLIELSNDTQRCRQLGRNAYDYYSTKASPGGMAQTLLDSISIRPG